MPQKTSPKILVSRTDHLGDVLLATPVATVLARIFPDARIDFLCDPGCEAVPRHHSNVSEVITFPSRDKGLSVERLLELVRALRSRQYDLAVLVYPDWRVALACWLARIPLRVGTGFRLYSFLFNKKVFFHRSRGKRRHEILYNLELLKALRPGITPLEKELSPRFQLSSQEESRVEQWLRVKSLWKKRYIVIHAGSFGSALNWGPEKYGEAARALAKKYGAKVVLTGTAAENELARKVAGVATVPCLDLTGQTDLVLLAGLFRYSLLVLGCSTGPLHLAAAVGGSVIGLYCPISVCGPWRWRPWGEKVEVVLSAPYMDCPVCIKQKCPYYDCMNLISISQVLDAGERLLGQKGKS